MSIWRAADVRPAVYDKYFTKKYGSDGGWESFAPETLWLDIKDETGHAPSQNVKDKINALKVLKTNEGFFCDPIIFEKIILAFNDSFVDSEMLQTCGPAEIAYGIPVAEEIVGRKEFDESVVTYIQACCEEWGLIVYPFSFRFAQRAFQKDSLEYHIYQDVSLGKYALHPSEWQRHLLSEINSYVIEKLRKRSA